MPLAIRSSPRGPYSTIVDACVQTAPTPARTCGTARPTNGTRVVTAAPDWPVTVSIAHSENVEYCGLPSSLMVTPSAARCCCAKAVDATRPSVNTRTIGFMITLKRSTEENKKEDSLFFFLLSAHPQTASDGRRAARFEPV